VAQQERYEEAKSIMVSERSRVEEDCQRLRSELQAATEQVPNRTIMIIIRLLDNSVMVDCCAIDFSFYFNSLPVLHFISPLLIASLFTSLTFISTA
jgi:hypothetical protein